MSDGDEPAAEAHPRWRRRLDVSWRLTLRGVVLLPPNAAEPVTVAGSGGLVWALLDRPRDTDDLVSELAGRFPTPVVDLRRDVAALIARLDGLGVLEQVPAVGEEPG